MFLKGLKAHMNSCNGLLVPGITDKPTTAWESTNMNDCDSFRLAYILEEQGTG